MPLLSLVGLYVAGVIGAGFASGQEPVFFFVKYGGAGIIGVFAAVLTLTVGSAAVLEYCKKKEINSYEGLFGVLGPWSATLYDFIYTVSLVTSVSIMVAGAGAIGSSPPQAVAFRLGTIFLIFAALHRGVQGVLRLAAWLTPVIVVLLLGVSLYRLLNSQLLMPEKLSWAGVEPALLYASYNLSFSMSVFASTHHVLKSKGQRWAAALLGNLILGVTMLVVVLSLGTLTKTEQNSSIPLLSVAASLGPFFTRGFKLVLWLSMYTTALSNSLVLVKRITSLSWVKGTLLVLGGVFFLSCFGFANLLQVAYPVLGLAGLFLLAHIIRFLFQGPNLPE